MRQKDAAFVIGRRGETLHAAVHIPMSLEGMDRENKEREVRSRPFAIHLRPIVRSTYPTSQLQLAHCDWLQTSIIHFIPASASSRMLWRATSRAMACVGSVAMHTECNPLPCAPAAVLMLRPHTFLPRLAVFS